MAVGRGEHWNDSQELTHGVGKTPLGRRSKESDNHPSSLEEKRVAASERGLCATLDGTSGMMMINITPLTQYKYT